MLATQGQKRLQGHIQPITTVLRGLRRNYLALVAQCYTLAAQCSVLYTGPVHNTEHPTHSPLALPTPHSANTRVVG